MNDNISIYLGEVFYDNVNRKILRKSDNLLICDLNQWLDNLNDSLNIQSLNFNADLNNSINLQNYLGLFVSDAINEKITLFKLMNNQLFNNNDVVKYNELFMNCDVVKIIK